MEILSKIMLKKRTKRVALASFPRSGNTWLRFLIEEATGQQSGSVYKDRILPRSQEGVAIKTHRLDSSEYSHAIHLIRNPYDAIESYFWYKKEFKQKNNINWSEHVIDSVQEWQKHTEHWLNVKYPVLRIRYEDLLTSTTYHLSEILAWLGYNPSPEEVLTVIEKSQIENMRQITSDSSQKFFRRGVAGRGIEKFTDEQSAMLVNTLYPLLVRLGYN